MKVFFLTFLFGVIYFVLKYLINAPIEPNMYDVGAFFVSALYSIVNIMFVFVLCLTSRMLYKQLSNLIFTFKYLIVEILSLYFLFEVFTDIYNEISLFSACSLAEKDTIQVLSPFIILYISWIIMLIARKCRHNNIERISSEY